jgi:hypothetical protein
MSNGRMNWKGNGRVGHGLFQGTASSLAQDLNLGPIYTLRVE